MITAPELNLDFFFVHVILFHQIAEVKGPGDKLSTKQQIWLDVLSSLGANVEVCYVTGKADQTLCLDKCDFWCYLLFSMESILLFTKKNSLVKIADVLFGKFNFDSYTFYLTSDKFRTLCQNIANI